jgi:hypothetical protein
MGSSLISRSHHEQKESTVLEMRIKLRKLNNPVSWLISFGLSLVGLSVGFWLFLSGQFHTVILENSTISVIILMILLYLAPAIVVYAIFRKHLSSLGYAVGIVTSGIAIYLYFLWLLLHALGGGP